MNIDGACTLLCPTCRKEPIRAGQRNGTACHTAYMRRYRAKHIAISVPRETLARGTARALRRLRNAKGATR